MDQRRECRSASERANDHRVSLRARRESYDALSKAAWRPELARGCGGALPMLLAFAGRWERLEDGTRFAARNVRCVKYPHVPVLSFLGSTGIVRT